MKKILLVFSLLILTSAIKAQDFRVGVKGGGNTTWLINTNVFATDQELDHSATFGATAGLSATYMFNNFLGLSLDVMYASVNQTYNGEFGNTAILYQVREKLRYIELPLMLKLASEKGPYFEIGPKFSLLTTQKEEINFEDPYQAFGDNGNYKDNFSPLVLSIALGFGVDIKIAENMYITTGLRLAYGPGDALEKKTDPEIQADLLSNNPHAMPFLQRYSSYKDGDYSGNDRVYKHEKTHIATGGLVVGYTYRFGGK